MLNKGRRPVGSDKHDNHNINEEIRAESVRLIGEEGEPKIILRDEAISMARERGLDLVEVSANQDPPVVKIIDFSKFKFEQIKKAKEAKKKQKVIHIKEIKLRPNIDSHDFEHKMKHARGFLEDGDKVKFTLMFRGREMVHSELGFDVMKKIEEALDDVAQLEKKASHEGRNITMFMSLKAGITIKKKEN